MKFTASESNPGKLQCSKSEKQYQRNLKRNRKGQALTDESELEDVTETSVHSAATEISAGCHKSPAVKKRMMGDSIGAVVDSHLDDEDQQHTRKHQSAAGRHIMDFDDLSNRVKQHKASIVRSSVVNNPVLKLKSSDYPKLLRYTADSFVDERTSPDIIMIAGGAHTTTQSNSGGEMAEGAGSYMIHKKHEEESFHHLSSKYQRSKSVAVAKSIVNCGAVPSLNDFRDDVSFAKALIRTVMFSHVICSSVRPRHAAACISLTAYSLLNYFSNLFFLFAKVDIP
jgi:hypothetical protein